MTSYLGRVGIAFATIFFAASVQAQPLDQWRSLFPGEPYICWQKRSPWTPLDRNQSPPEGVERVQPLHAAMGTNEYESTSFVVTNLSDEAMTFDLACDAGDVAITLRQAVWVTVNDGTEINDALSLIDDGRVVIASGESLEIWLTLHTDHVTPGKRQQSVTVTPQGFAPRTIDIEVDVHDVALPRRLPLAVFYWDEIVATWDSLPPPLVEAYMADMKSHYVNHAYVHPDPLPRLAVDSSGKLATDYGELDITLDGYAPLDAQRFIFFWAANTFLEPTGDWAASHPESVGRPQFMSEPWKQLFRQWLNEWVAHLKDRGIGYDRFVMHPYDERSGPEVLAVLKLIEEVDANIQTAFNGTIHTAQDVEKFAPHVDVWIPHLYPYLDRGGINGYLIQTVALEPNTTYTYSFQGKNGSSAIYFDLIFNGSTSRYAQLLDAAMWRQATTTFTTTADTTQVQIRYFPTIGNKTILIDDVVLQSESGTNLVVNGDMEEGQPPHGWNTSSAELVVNRTDAYAGRQCVQVTNIPLKHNPAKDAAKRLLGHADGQALWTYANPPVGLPSKTSPYVYYRLPVWTCWQERMTGYSTWTYKNARWDSEGIGPNWGLVYRSNDDACPPHVSRRELVVPSKRWEACREGVEDYAYLHMLREAIDEAQSRGADTTTIEQATNVLHDRPAQVLASDTDISLADQAKVQIMQAIESLSPKQP
jgi:hypothetical protein